MLHQNHESYVEKIQSIKVVIIGGVHHNTLGVVRSIGDSPIKKQNIILVLVGSNAKNNDFVSKSKYVDKRNVFYLNDDIDIVPFLLNHDKSEKKVIICCSDGSVEQIIKNKHILLNYHCPSIIVDIDVIMNKQEQSAFVKSRGMLIPESTIIEKNKCVSLDWNEYPCIIKPIKSICGGGKDDIKIAQSRGDLVDKMNNSLSEIFQVQKYIDKKMEYQLIGCSLNDGENVIIPGYTRILRQQRNTNTGYLEYSPLSNVQIDMDRVKNILKEFGYNGLFSMEFIRDKNDNDYYLETNFRNDGNGYCVKTAGVNLPFIWCYYSFFGELPSEIKKNVDQTIKFIPDLEDVKLGCNSVGVFRWIKEFFKAESHAVYSLSDIRPFVSQVNKRVHKFVKSKLRHN